MARLRRRRKDKNIVINDQTRLFIGIPDSDCCGAIFSYHSCVNVGDISKANATQTKLYCPDPDKYNEFVVVTTISGEDADGSLSLSTNYNLNTSALEKMYKKGCYFPLQVHIGSCTNPSDFSQFEKAIILTDALVTNYTLSNLTALNPSARGVVTESIDITFADILTVTAPNFALDLETALTDGPIIDSFTFCEDSCCMCPNGSGRYVVQLYDCGTDCTQLRILYQTDCGDWRAINHPSCEGFDCNQFFNNNILFDNDGYHYLHLSGNFGTDVFSTILNSKITIPLSALLNNSTLKAADGCGTKVIFVGDNGYIFVYNTETGTYRQVINSNIPITNNHCEVKFCPDDCCTYAIGGTTGIFYVASLDDDTTASTYALNSINDVHELAFPSCCSVVAAAGDDGLFHINLSNGTITQAANIFGTITALSFPNEFVGYAVSVSGTTVYIWMTVDGGLTWSLVNSDLDTTYVVTTISACCDDPSIVTVAGRIMSTAPTIAEMISCDAIWQCDDSEGFIYRAGEDCPSYSNVMSNGSC